MEYFFAFFLITGCLLLIKVARSHAATSDDVVKLHDDLFKDYRKIVRPVRNQNDVVQLNISFFIIMIHDLDLKNQVLTTNAWLRITWRDEFLRWNKSDYGGLPDVLVSRNEVWTPDLLVENTAFGYRELGIDEMLLSLDHNGVIIWEPGIVMQTICEVNIAKYPFDNQHCAIRVMSWMYTNKSLHVRVERNTVDVTGYYPNGEWDLSSTFVRAYSPEDGSYNTGEILPGAEAIVELRRRPVYYIISTILPISMLSLLNVLVFMLPMNTGEKMTLAVTVLLSFTVFMSVVNEVMPKTSNSISILVSKRCRHVRIPFRGNRIAYISDLDNYADGDFHAPVDFQAPAVYLTILLSMSGLSVASTVLVLHFHHKDAAAYKQPPSVIERMDDVHNTRLYRVCRPSNSSGVNNNRRKSHLQRNGLRPSTEKLLQDYMEIDDSDGQRSSEEGRSCCGRRLRCRFCRRRRCHSKSDKEFAEKLDRVLFFIVTILTILSTVVAMILLCYW